MLCFVIGHTTFVGGGKAMVKVVHGRLSTVVLVQIHRVVSFMLQAPWPLSRDDATREGRGQLDIQAASWQRMPGASLGTVRAK